MKRLLLANVAVAILGITAFAQGQGQGQTTRPGMTQGQPFDINKMGPWTRKPKNEQATMKEISAFMKEEEQIMKQGNLQAALERVDFPVYMATDDSQGMPMAREFSRDEYNTMMRPVFEAFPKDAKITHKHTIHVLSDSLATINDDFTMTANQKTYSGRSHGLLVKRDGRWKWKTMVEAGWGDMSAAAAYGQQQQQQMQQQQQQQPMKR